MQQKETKSMASYSLKGSPYIQPPLRGRVYARACHHEVGIPGGYLRCLPVTDTCNKILFSTYAKREMNCSWTLRIWGQFQSSKPCIPYWVITLLYSPSKHEKCWGNLLLCSAGGNVIQWCLAEGKLKPQLCPLLGVWSWADHIYPEPCKVDIRRTLYSQHC